MTLPLVCSQAGSEKLKIGAAEVAGLIRAHSALSYSVASA